MRKSTLLKGRLLGEKNSDNLGSRFGFTKQAKTVRRIYREFLNGKSARRIAKDLEADGVPNWNGKVKWYDSSIKTMLSNEKYKGEALLQKTYTVDFLSKKERRILDKFHSIMWWKATLQLLRRIFGKQYSLRWSVDNYMLLNMALGMEQEITPLQEE